jgi:hypothetical protein
MQINFNGVIAVAWVKNENFYAHSNALFWGCKNSHLQYFFMYDFKLKNIF